MISAVVLTKNEKKNIKDCMTSLSFCNEIIVVDDKSIDGTSDIAKKLGARLFIRDMNKDFSAQSNFGMEKAGGNWILFIDADERVSNKLSREIIKITKLSIGIKGFFMNRTDYFWGRKLRYGETGSVKLMRLVRKGSGKWKRRVHPYFEIEGKTSHLKNPILHYPHPDTASFIVSIDRWSTWHALANDEEGKISDILKICFWPVAHFFRNYVFRLGFLDGMPGFIFAFIMSFHSFLAWSKLYLIQSKLK